MKNMFNNPIKKKIKIALTITIFFFLRKTIMTDMTKGQPLNYGLLTWDRHISNVAVLNMFASA